MAYAWKEGARGAVPAQLAGDEIARIRDGQGGYVTPSAVVLAARPQGAPLHPAFEWDDRRAAVAHRLDQARYLIRSIVIIEHVDQQPVRAFVSVTIRGEDNPGTLVAYTSFDNAMSDPDMQEQLMAQARADMRAFERKYDQLVDLTRTIQVFNRALLAVEQGKRKLAG